jgi:hypothetical protein
MTNHPSLARKVRLRLSLLFSLLAALVVAPVYATVMRYMSVEDLTRRSSDVIYGQVISAEADWNSDRTRILTRIRVRIDEALKGSLTPSQIVTVTQFGGEINGHRWDYAGRPIFTAGELVVLFTTRGKQNDLNVVGLKQGKMYVEKGEVRRDLSGITFVERAPGGRGFQQVAPQPFRMTLVELRNRIAATR